MAKVSILLVCLFLGCVLTDVPKLLLNDGHKIPIVGLGTASITEDAVRVAVEDGYRHIDTSLNYNDSELIIGRVLKDVFKAGKAKREDFYIVSKLEADYHQRKRVPEGIKTSLKRLGLDYLDLYLIHWPQSSPVGVPLVETWQGMIDVLKANLTRSIGVSNFDVDMLEEIYANGTYIRPVTNQVLCNPYRNQKKLLSYLTKHNITLTAYSPLGGRGHDPTVPTDPKLVAIGKRHNVSAAQVALKYQVQRGVIVIPKSNNAKYIKEDFDLFSFTLTDEEMKEVDSLNKVDG